MTQIINFPKKSSSCNHTQGKPLLTPSEWREDTIERLQKTIAHTLKKCYRLEDHLVHAHGYTLSDVRKITSDTGE